MASKIGVLVDLSGTLHIENTVIPGAVEALEKLRKMQNVKLQFVTNTTKESGRFLHERLTKLGFAIDRSEIFTSLIAARNLIEQRGLNPMFLLEDEALEDFDIILQHNAAAVEPDSVVVGLAPSKFNFETMNKAFNLVLNGASLIGIHKARYYKTNQGLNLGPGPFITALEYATDKKADVVGKPEKTFFVEALKRCDCDASNSFMIGDDVRDDVGGAQNTGMKGILVKTGKYRENDERKIDPAPWRVVDDFTSAVKCIESVLN